MADTLAGIAIAAVIIPQAIGMSLDKFRDILIINVYWLFSFLAYSSLANVPPVYGLYTAWVNRIIRVLLISYNLIYFWNIHL